jgi:hypothetical protein
LIDLPKTVSSALYATAGNGDGGVYGG